MHCHSQTHSHEVMHHTHTHTHHELPRKGVLYWVFFRKYGSSKALVRWKAKSRIDRPRAWWWGVERVLWVCVCVCRWGAEPVVCLPDAGLPARRGAKGQGVAVGGQWVVAVALWLQRNPVAPQWRFYGTCTTHAHTHTQCKHQCAVVDGRCQRLKQHERESTRQACTKPFSPSYLCFSKHFIIWNVLDSSTDFFIFTSILFWKRHFSNFNHKKWFKEDYVHSLPSLLWTSQPKSEYLFQSAILFSRYLNSWITIKRSITILKPVNNTNYSYFSSKMKLVEYGSKVM